MKREIYAQQLERRIRDLEARLLRRGATGAQGPAGASDLRLDPTWDSSFLAHGGMAGNVAQLIGEWAVAPDTVETVFLTAIGREQKGWVFDIFAGGRFATIYRIGNGAATVVAVGNLWGSGAGALTISVSGGNATVMATGTLGESWAFSYVVRRLILPL